MSTTPTAPSPGSPAPGPAPADGSGPRPGRGVTPSGAWTVVARREVTVKLTDRTFLVSTLVTLLLITALVVVQAVTSDGTSDYRVAATPASAEMAAVVANRAPDVDRSVAVTVDRVPDDAAARAAVTSGDADAWLHPSGDGWVLTGASQVPGGLESVTAQVVRGVVIERNAARAGTSIATLQAGSVLRTALLEGDPRTAGVTQAVGFAFAFLFYIASLIYGLQLAQSVVEEKQSRIIEIIATSIPVRQLLAGKVVGNAALAFGQLALYLAVGVAGLGLTDYGSVLPSLTWPVLWFLVFFLGGFLALACLWAVAGSLASRNEDLQATTTPLTLVIVGTFFGGLLLEGTARTVASFVPPLSAVLMPMRLLDGQAAWWEPVLALVLLLGFAGVTIVLGERIYRRALLQGRVGLRQAWSAPE